MKKYSNSFHLVNPSPWPIMISLFLLSVAISIISLIMKKSLEINFLLMLILMLMFTSFLWWNDLKRESNYFGEHSNTMVNLLKYSMVMFIISEVMFFASFFWSFFHLSVSPDVELGLLWPPMGIMVFDPMGMPLLNSLILLSSGCTITWSHHSFIKGNVKLSVLSLALTISLGILFTICQGIEYLNSNFSFSDSCYGSVFFLATGFHGVHVIVGSIFLFTSLLSMMMFQNFNYHFISMDLSAWYWHFVDVVWLFLYTSIYWWGSMK